MFVQARLATAGALRRGGRKCRLPNHSCGLSRRAMGDRAVELRATPPLSPRSASFATRRPTVPRSVAPCLTMRSETALKGCSRNRR